jgi:hypothetical protein
MWQIKTLALIAVLVIGLISFSLAESVSKDLKGAIHIHIKYPGDDGANTLDEVVVAYKSKGYDFIVVTPHNESLWNKSFGYTKDNFTVIYGHESNWGFHQLWFGPHDSPIEILAHPYRTIQYFRDHNLPDLYSNRPEPDFVEVVNNRSITDYPLLSNGIAGEDMHNLKNGYGNTWVILENTENNVDAIYNSFLKYALDKNTHGRIPWGCNSTVEGWTVPKTFKKDVNQD